MKKFKAVLETEATKVTNIANVFFDLDSINWGNEFDDQIYEGIVSCYFFIPFYHNSYLHHDNLWCAKELYRAIEVEKKIRENGIPNYCFILPIIDRGSASAFPECIGRKNAKEIKQFRHLVLSNKTSKAFEQFKEDIYNILLCNYNLIAHGTSFVDMCKDIEVPSDEEIMAWVRAQKEIEQSQEAKKLPVFKKNNN